MRPLTVRLVAAILISAYGALAVAQDKAPDLRRAVPADVFLVTLGKHNPERDFQRQYLEDVWKTVQQTQIIERAAKIVTTRMPQADVQKAEAVVKELKDAAAPIPLKAIANCQEVVYAQFMQTAAGETKTPIVSQHLLLMRLTPEAATQTQEGIKNLFGLVEKYTEGKVPVQSATQGDAVIVSLSIPQEVPFRPTVIRIKDVILLSSSEALARQSLEMLVGGKGQSKFDDPRLKEALRKLPEPEDSLTFFDAKQLFANMRTLVDFIHHIGRGQPEPERVAGLMEVVFDELAALDYEVTVEYTEGNLNRSAVYGQLVSSAQDKLLLKMFGSGKPFENWQQWIPADAVSYSLSTGANLHPLYQRVIELLKERIPESKPGLERFEQIQSQLGVHLDQDILQAFSGESVSITLPPATASLLGSGDTVMALRCHKPDRIRELLHRLVDWLKEQPPLKAQELQLAKSDDLEGFEEISAVMLAGFGIKPVIGFHEGWMIVGSNTQAIKKVLDTKAGKAPTIAGTKAFQQFKLDIEGPVTAVHYTNMAENTRQIAAVLNQAGFLLPMIVNMAGADKVDAESMKPVQELVGLLPSLGKIVAKFDFLEASLSVTQAADEPGAYRRRSVTVVRPPSGQ